MKALAVGRVIGVVVCWEANPYPPKKAIRLGIRADVFLEVPTVDLEEAGMVMASTRNTLRMLIDFMGC